MLISYSEKAEVVKQNYPSWLKHERQCRMKMRLCHALSYRVNPIALKNCRKFSTVEKIFSEKECTMYSSHKIKSIVSNMERISCPDHNEIYHLAVVGRYWWCHIQHPAQLLSRYCLRQWKENDKYFGNCQSIHCLKNAKKKKKKQHVLGFVQLSKEKYFCLLIYRCLDSSKPHIRQNRLLNQSCQNKAV